MCVCVCVGGSSVFPLFHSPPPPFGKWIRQQWEKRTRNIINKNANRYATDGVVFYFFFVRVCATDEMHAETNSRPFFFPNGRLYFLRPNSPALDRTPSQPRSSPVLQPTIPAERYIFYIGRLKNNVLRVFLFHTYTVCVYYA